MRGVRKICILLECHIKMKKERFETIRKRFTFCESEGGAGAAVGGGRHMIRQNGARRLPTVCKTFSFADSCTGSGISQGMPGIRFPVCVVRVFRA